MKIQVVSDLHLDFCRNQHKVDRVLARILEVECDVLVIAGDFAEMIHPAWFSSLKHLCQYTPNVIYVPGNHEYYKSTPSEVESAISIARDCLPNLHPLDCSEVEIDGVNFAGATLWFQKSSDARDYKHRLNDYNQIRGFVPWVYDQAEKARSYLMASEADVFVTHHLPSPHSVPEGFKGSAMNCYYVNDVLPLVEKPPKLWLHGHTHTACDYEFTDWDSQVTTRVVANPLGYPGQTTGFGFEKVIAL